MTIQLRFFFACGGARRQSVEIATNQMRRPVLKKLTIAFQILALFMIQFNTLAPQVARLYPAIFSGDLTECRCTLECRCSPELRQGGICCCKKLKKLKLKMHCNSAPRKPGTFSLRNCPCDGSTHISFVSTDGLAFIPATISQDPLAPPPGFLVSHREPRKLCGRVPEPPDPPPRRSFSRGTEQPAHLFS